MSQIEFELKFTVNAQLELDGILNDPSLNTHKYNDLEGPRGEDVFESYAQNNTPGAYRIFWFYGPGKKQISVLKICEYP